LAHCKNALAKPVAILENAAQSFYRIGRVATSNADGKRDSGPQFWHQFLIVGMRY
jgi:hypothetical protein